MFSALWRQLAGRVHSGKRPWRRSRWRPAMEELESRLTPAEVGANDFRISFMGPNGDTTHTAFGAAVAYNPTANEYLAVWSGDDNGDEIEIYGQRINGATGALIGSEIRISDLGPDGNASYTARDPAVTYNPTSNEYLVVWWGEDTTILEWEIWGQRLDANPATFGEVGTNDFRISDMGPDGSTSFRAVNPSVVHNSTNNQYLVVWEGNDNTPPVPATDFEIFGQRLAADGTELGANDFRISDMGTDGNDQIFASEPDVAFNSTTNEYLVVWHGEDDTAPLVNNEFEIYGQRIDGATGAEVGTNDFRISDVGPDGSTSFSAREPAVAYNNTNNEYLVVWFGDDDALPAVDNEIEIFGQRLSAAGAEIGANDFRISDSGPDLNSSFEARVPDVAYNPTRNEYIVVWEAEDTTDGENEIFGQRLNAATGAEVGTNDFRLSDMGTDGSANFDAVTPAVAFNSVSNEYLVVWLGDDNVAPLVQDETEVFGQRFNSDSAAPTISLPGPTVNYTENDPASILDGTATVVDADSADFDTGTLTVQFTANGEANDLLQVRNQGIGAGLIGTSGSTVTFSGNAIGTFAGGTGTTPLVITFSGANATPAAAEALLRNITYANVSDAPGTGARTVQFTLTDGEGGTSNAATKTVNVTAVADNPVLDLNGPGAGSDHTATFTEDGGPVSIVAGTATFADPDDGNLQSATVTITNRPDGASEVLAATPSGAILAGNIVFSNGVLTITQSASRADYEAVLRSVTYNNSSQNPNTTARSVTFVINDGTANSAAGTTTVTVNAANDAPVITEGASTTVNMSEDGNPTPFNLTLNATDAEGNTLTWSIDTQATNGIASVSGTGTSRAISYTPNGNFNGSDSFVVKVDDGNGGSDLITVNVNIAAVNDAPVIAEGASTTVNMSEDGNPTPFSLTLNASDLEGNTLTWSIDTQATNGTASVSGTGNSKVVSYTPNPNFSGTDSFVVRVSDGQGGSDLITVNVNVAGANDAPVIGEGNSTTVNMSEDGLPTPFGLTLNAADADGNTLTWSIDTQATNGIASVSGTGASKAVNYTPNVHFNGTDSFVVRVSDGQGGFDLITVNVNVAAVNDAPDADLNGPGAGNDHAATFNAGGGPVNLVAPPATITDVDNANLLRVTVTITNRMNGAAETLSATVGATGIVSAYDTGTGVLTLTGPATRASFEQVLRTVQYSNLATDPTPGGRNITFVVNDGAADSVSRSSVVTVNGRPVVPPPERGITARLVPVKQGKRRVLFVVVSFKDTGVEKFRLRSPFQKPNYRNIAVSVLDSDGNGQEETVVLKGRKGNKLRQRFFPG